jgi:hypothetical protein
MWAASGGVEADYARAFRGRLKTERNARADF